MLCFAVTLKLFDGTVPPVRARQTVSRRAQRVSHLGNRLSLHLVDALRVRDGECRDRTTLRVQNRKTDGEQATDLHARNGLVSRRADRIERRVDLRTGVLRPPLERLLDAQLARLFVLEGQQHAPGLRIPCIGAAIGASVSQRASIPHSAVLVSVGMATFLAALTQTPVSAAIMVVELTGCDALAPLLLCCAASSPPPFITLAASHPLQSVSCGPAVDQLAPLRSLVCQRGA